MLNRHVRHYGRTGKGHNGYDDLLLKNMKAVHLLMATAWAGGALSMQALSFLRMNTADPATAALVAQCLRFVDTWVVIPGLLGCIVTGLFYSVFTAIGFVKFAWIAYKWFFTLNAAIWGTLFWLPWGDELILWLSYIEMDAPLRFIRAFILPENMWEGLVQILVILSMCLISVYRPRAFSRKRTLPPAPPIHQGHVVQDGDRPASAAARKTVTTAS